MTVESVNTMKGEPKQFRELHHSGFARFQLTETSKVVNHPLTLATICNDGTVVTRFQNTFPAQSQQGALADAKRAKRLSSRRRESHCSWNLGLA